MVSRKPGELDEHINLIFINGVLFGKTQNHQHFFPQIGHCQMVIDGLLPPKNLGFDMV